MKSIIFNTEMVKAILDGRKTQTRRVIPLKNNDLIFTGFVVSSTAKNREGYCAFGKNKEQDLEFIKPKYKVGDVLYVRESAKIVGYVDCDAHFQIVYQFLSDGKIESLTHDDLINKHKLEDHEFQSKYLSKKYIEKLQKIPNGCLKEMARIFLKVTNVRVERLQNISDEVCLKDGIENVTNYNPIELHRKFDTFRFNGCCYNSAKYAFKNIWNSTAKDGYRWEDNPYVFVYEFERIHDV